MVDDGEFELAGSMFTDTEKYAQVNVNQSSVNVNVNQPIVVDQSLVNVNLDDHLPRYFDQYWMLSEL